MQNIKKCSRLVLSLLLVCGCFLKFFSGSAYAAVSGDTVEKQYFFPSYGTTENGGGMNVAYYVGNPVPIQEPSIYSGSGANSSSVYVPVKSSVTVTVEVWNNLTSDAILSNPDTNRRVFSLPPISSIGLRNNGSVSSVSSFSCWTTDYSYGSIATVGYPLMIERLTTGQFYISADPSYLYNGAIVIPAGETTRTIFSFDIYYTIQFSIGWNASWSDQSKLNYIYDILSSYELSINLGTSDLSSLSYSVIPEGGWVDPSDLGSLIEDQTQQQQDQYEDFTDPDSDGGSGLVSDTETELESKIGIFTFINDILQDFLGLFVVPEDSSATLTFPAFTLSVGGESYEVWDEHEFDFSSIESNFGGLLSAVRFATVLLVYLALINFLVKTFNRIIGGTNDG